MSTPTSTIADPALGLFHDRYRLEQLLGDGFSGEVWHAHDTHTGRVVALKVLDASKTTPDAAWREATRLTALESPFLLRVHGAAMAIDVPYLDMELAVGGTVANASEPLGVAPEVAVRWTRHVAQGLHLCHQRGLLHRDVKPDNIFLTSTRDARLGDFGTAAVLGTDGTADVGGDPQIRAPEVLKGGRCSVASDIYALGITLHALLVGRLPFRWRDFGAFPELRAAALGGPPDIRDVAPHVGISLAKIVRKALTAQPAERFSSASEFDAALSRLPTPQRVVTEVAPHPEATRCWTADARVGGAASTVHVCVAAIETRRFEVSVRHAPSGTRIRKHCQTVARGSLAKHLRSVFGDLT